MKSALVDLDDDGASLMNDAEFRNFQRFIYERAGITLSSGKKALVASRLAKRLNEHGLRSYAEYFRLIASGSAAEEAQITIDLLTTNETYFFREPKHFELLRRLALAARGRLESFRVWSAASSSGEEAYSIAMTLDDCLQGGAWDVLGTDISSRVLARAQMGHYLMDRTDNIPREYLRKYCRKGLGDYEGTLLVSRELRSRVRFERLNLNEALPQLGSFDVIFLRNVMIYFDDETKRQVVQRLTATLKPGGYFLIGHSETLNGLCTNLDQVAPAVYRASRRTRSGE